jgi:hypothetical protein
MKSNMISLYKGEFMSWTEAPIEAFAEVMGRVLSLFAIIVSSIINFDLSSFPGIDQAITSTAVSLATLFFAMQFISEVSAFRMDGIEEAIRLGMKVVIAKIILENSGAISNMIFEMFWGLSTTTLTSSILSLADSFDSIVKPIEPGLFGINNIIALITNVIPALIASNVMLCSLVITIAGIVFEVLMHQQVAPIALSTLVNDTTRGTGIAFIKSYAAVCLQLGVIGVCVTIYDTLNQSVRSAYNAFANFFLEQAIIGPILNTIFPLLMFVCLTSAIKRSGDITKRMLGA